MAITPQAIRDQEFQVKFRGYDTVEVKAYLELFAEEYFELLEQVRQQIDEQDVIVAERDALKARKAALEKEIIASRGSSDEIKTEFAERDTEVIALRNEIDSLKKKANTLEREKKTKAIKIEEMESRILLKEEGLLAEKMRNDKLANRAETLTKQNDDLRKEEIDFKSTLVAAQQFTSDLKKKSEIEAKQIINKARADAEQLRQDTFAELARYPAEIEELKEQRNKVRDDLEAILHLSLESLEIFNDDEKEEISEDFGELFQSIKIDENGEVEEEDLQSINMEFDLPKSSRDVPENGFSVKDDNLEDDFSMKDEMKDLGGEFT